MKMESNIYVECKICKILIKMSCNESNWVLFLLHWINNIYFLCLFYYCYSHFIHSLVFIHKRTRLNKVKLIAAVRCTCINIWALRMVNNTSASRNLRTSFFICWSQRSKHIVHAVITISIAKRAYTKSMNIFFFLRRQLKILYFLFLLLL